jgi:hypothetical protein
LIQGDLVDYTRLTREAILPRLMKDIRRGYA